MIDRQGGNVVFECDSCSDVLETETGNFDAAWNQAKREGWRARKVGTDWVHECLGCNTRN